MGRSYYISAAIDREVRESANHRCGYCLSPQHLMMARLEIEHIVPLAKQGSSDSLNLWLACPPCNRFKGDKVMAIVSWDWWRSWEEGDRVIHFHCLIDLLRRYGLLSYLMLTCPFISIGSSQSRSWVSC